MAFQVFAIDTLFLSILLNFIVREEKKTKTKFVVIKLTRRFDSNRLTCQKNITKDIKKIYYWLIYIYTKTKSKMYLYNLHLVLLHVKCCVNTAFGTFFLSFGRFQLKYYLIDITLELSVRMDFVSILLKLDKSDFKCIFSGKSIWFVNHQDETESVLFEFTKETD